MGPASTKAPPRLWQCTATLAPASAEAAPPRRRSWEARSTPGAAAPTPMASSRATVTQGNWRGRPSSSVRRRPQPIATTAAPVSRATANQVSTAAPSVAAERLLQGAIGRSSPAVSAGRVAGGASAAQDPVHHLQQLVDPGLAAAGLDLVADAAADVAVEQPEGHLVEGGLDGRDLGDHVDAVLVLVDHAGDAADLPLDAAQAGLELLLLHGVAGHGPSSVCMPTRVEYRHGTRDSTPAGGSGHRRPADRGH